MTPLPAKIVLTADLTRRLPEGASDDPLVRLLLGGKTTLRDFLDAIEAAGNDPRVKVLLARVGDDELGLAKIQEVRASYRAQGLEPPAPTTRGLMLDIEEDTGA